MMRGTMMRILIIVTSVSFSDALHVRHVHPLPRKITKHHLLSKPSDESSGSLAKFAGDVTSIIKDIRAGPDLTVPDFFRERYPFLSMADVWNNEAWDRHMSRWRYLREIVYIFRSRLLKRIAPQLTVTLVWAYIVCKLVAVNHPLTQKMHMSLTSLSLVSTFVAALLTLRSNQGLSRLAEARSAWGRVVALSRDTAQSMATYVYPLNPELGILSARHLSIFGWLLKCRLREEDDSDIIEVILPMSPDREFILSQRKRPVALLQRLRQIIAFMGPQLPYAAHVSLEKNIYELNRVFGRCERVKGSCIPPLYTAHVTRLLVFYIFFLPFALATAGVSIVPDMVTTGAVAFAMMGLDEIGHILEQPFRLMPMHQQSINAMQDVADAFVCQPPPIQGDCKNSDFQYPFGTGNTKKPEYW